MTPSCDASRDETAPPSHYNSWKSWRRRLRRRTILMSLQERTSRSRSTSLKPEYRFGFKIEEQSGGKQKD